MIRKVEGGGIAMNKLHDLGITGDKKGRLKRGTVDNEIKLASGKYLNTLLKYKDKLKNANGT